jgi:hypothetical protein
MSTVIIGTFNVANFPEGGGHFWVYMQYVQGFLRQGCEVYWLEEFVTSGDEAHDARTLARFTKQMEHFGLKGKTILYTTQEGTAGADQERTYIGMDESKAKSLFATADLLLNFYYAMHPTLLAEFKRTALVDIDPSLLQLWISTGQIEVAKHDYYCTTGETVGTSTALFPDCDISWINIRPAVSLELWPYSYSPDADAFTTISGWWGDGGRGEFVTDYDELVYENNKRVTFLEYVELPQQTPQTLELALNLGTAEIDEAEMEPTKLTADGQPITDYRGDAVDRRKLIDHGWNIANPYKVANSPAAYQTYIQNPRGEFSCAKPSYIKFQSAWVSDRTICYLASGKPVVVQNTGPSSFLPDGEGMFRFSTMGEAVDAITTINANYEKHCSAAREIAESYFDARKIAADILKGCDL